MVSVAGSFRIGVGRKHSFLPPCSQIARLTLAVTLAVRTQCQSVGEMVESYGNVTAARELKGCWGTHIHTSIVLQHSRRISISFFSCVTPVDCRRGETLPNLKHLFLRMKPEWELLLKKKKEAAQPPTRRLRSFKSGWTEFWGGETVEQRLWIQPVFDDAIMRPLTRWRGSHRVVAVFKSLFFIMENRRAALRDTKDLTWRKQKTNTSIDLQKMASFVVLCTAHCKAFFYLWCISLTG